MEEKMIEFIQVNNEFADMKSLDELNKTAFPPDEYLSIENQLELQKKGVFTVWAVYFNSDFAGFVSLRFYKEMVYLCFLAVEENLRSKGIGSMILKKIEEIYTDKQLAVDFELIDSDAENNSQRIKRKNFYLRNGFTETGWGTRYFGVSYEICSLNEYFDIELFKEMMLNADIPDFSPVYFRI